MIPALQTNLKKMVRPWLILSMALATSGLPALEMGKPAPNCTLYDLNNRQPHQLQQLTGKVLFVDFWASWCGPCAKSFPYYNALQQKFSQQHFQILAINLDEEPEDARHFLEHNSSQISVLGDKDSQCAQMFSVMAMPSSYLIDRSGNIRYIQLGFREDETSVIEHKITELLAEK